MMLFNNLNVEHDHLHLNFLLFFSSIDLRHYFVSGYLMTFYLHFIAFNWRHSSIIHSYSFEKMLVFLEKHKYLRCLNDEREFMLLSSFLFAQYDICIPPLGFITILPFIFTLVLFRKMAICKRTFSVYLMEVKATGYQLRIMGTYAWRGNTKQYEEKLYVNISIYFPSPLSPIQVSGTTTFIKEVSCFFYRPQPSHM